LDIASEGERLYILTETGVYCSTGDASLTMATENPDKYTNLAVLGDSIFFWSKGAKKPLVQAADGTGQNIFSPVGAINSVKVSGSKLVILDGNSAVYVYNAETRELLPAYTGSGIQDALLYSTGDLIVAKSTTDNPPTPLIRVNIATREIVRIGFDADVTFTLSVDPANEMGAVYGIRIDSKKSARTAIFSYLPESDWFSQILQSAEDAPQSFIACYDGILYTNLGGNSITAYDIFSRKQTPLQRAAALPQKIIKTGEMLAVLNQDGSISWYNPQNPVPEETWHLKLDGTKVSAYYQQ
jgi:hypothetical protein